MWAHRTRACHRGRPALALAVTLLAIASLLSSAPVRAASPDAVVRTVLDEITAHGWNPTVGGLYINWSVDDPSQVNQPGGAVTRHDGLTELRDLANMLWYQRRHPGDGSQAAAIARLAPVVQGEFQRYGSDKGWVYWELLRLADLGGGRAFVDEARAFAAHLATIVDPATGVSHGMLSASTAEAAATCPDGYRVDHDLESGLALVDAGARFGDASWSAVGAREVDVVVGQTFDTAHHLFNRIVCQGSVWDRHAKIGEQADDITALLEAGTATHNAAYIARAQEMLDALAGPAGGLHDTARGGYFFMLDMGTGAVDSSYKETRQLAMLGAFHRANALTGARYAAAEAEMARVALQMWTSAPLSGYPYREAPQFGFFGRERWITTESAGIALEALQATLGDVQPAPVRAPAPAARPAQPVAVAPPPPPAPPPPVVTTPEPAAVATPAAPADVLPTAPVPDRPATPPITAARAPAATFPWGPLALAVAIAIAAAYVARRVMVRLARGH
jgi:hypothetical protein